MPISWWNRIFRMETCSVFSTFELKRGWQSVQRRLSSLTEHWVYFYSAVSARSRQQQLQPLSHYKPAGSLFWSVLIWQFSHGGFRFNITITITFPNLLLSTQTNVYFWMLWTIFACFVWINVVFFIIMLSFTHLRVVQPSQENPYFDHHLYQLFL